MAGVPGGAELGLIEQVGASAGKNLDRQPLIPFGFEFEKIDILRRGEPRIDGGGRTDEIRLLAGVVGFGLGKIRQIAGVDAQANVR